jgi:hypothetical protein
VKIKTTGRRSSNLFARRAIITLPNYAPFLIAFALFLGIVQEAVTLSMAVMTIVTVMSLACIIVSRYQVKLLRDEVSKILRGIEMDDYEETTSTVDEQPAERVRLVK